MPERIPLSPPPDAIRSFVAGREAVAGMQVRFFLVGDAIESEWTVTPAFEGWSGLAHGTVFAALHDEAAINAIVFLRGGTGFTRRLDVRFLRPLRLGDRVRVRANVAKETPRGAVVAGEIRLLDGSADGALVSTAETEYAYVDRATVERVLGAPVSPMLAEWFAAGRERRIELALEWSRKATGG